MRVDGEGRYRHARNESSVGRQVPAVPRKDVYGRDVGEGAKWQILARGFVTDCEQLI